MSQSQIERLKDRIFKRKGSHSKSELTPILDMAREFSCLSELLGRDFEIRDKNNKLLYKIRQKPIAIKQLNVLMKEFEILKRQDYKREAAKWGNKKPGRLDKRR